MNPLPMTPAAITQPSPQALVLSGYWTARGVGAIGPQLDALSFLGKSEMVIDAAHIAALASAPLSNLEGLGQRAGVACVQTLALLSFVGESASALAGCITHPARLRWRPIRFNIRSAGFDALPIRRGPNLVCENICGKREIF